jgi:hypothetical protein
MAPLSDVELAALLNWTIVTFDSENVPHEFEPYTAEEVGLLRNDPLGSQTSIVRAELLERARGKIEP